MTQTTIKKPRKKIYSTNNNAEKVVKVVIHKQLKKIQGISKLPYKQLFIHSKNNQIQNFDSIDEIGEFLEKHSLMYFDIPEQDLPSIVFPEKSKDFLLMFFELNKKYNTKVVHQDLTINSKKYRSLGEIYLTTKFYYSKVTWKLFLKNFFNTLFKDEIIEKILNDQSISLTERNVSNSEYAATLVCQSIHRRVFSIPSIDKRHLSSVNHESIVDEFNFTLKDYLNYIK